MIQIGYSLWGRPGNWGFLRRCYGCRYSVHSSPPQKTA
jgi:hypothetical protein